MRYGDCSNPAQNPIRAQGDKKWKRRLNCAAKIAGAFQVKNRRTHGRSSLFIFEVTATDPDKDRPPDRGLVVLLRNPCARANMINDDTKRFTWYPLHHFWPVVLASHRATFSLRSSTNLPMNSSCCRRWRPGPNSGDD